MSLFARAATRFNQTTLRQQWSWYAPAQTLGGSRKNLAVLRADFDVFLVVHGPSNTERFHWIFYFQAIRN